MKISDVFLTVAMCLLCFGIMNPYPDATMKLGDGIMTGCLCSLVIHVMFRMLNGSKVIENSEERKTDDNSENGKSVVGLFASCYSEYLCMMQDTHVLTVIMYLVLWISKSEWFKTCFPETHKGISVTVMVGLTICAMRATWRTFNYSAEKEKPTSNVPKSSESIDNSSEPLAVENK